METSQDALPRPAPDRRDRSIEARLRARRKKGARERHIIDLLNRGVSLAEIATSRGVTLRRMQILVKTILARRAPAAPEEYLALQVSRLNEAMYVAIGEIEKGRSQGDRPGDEARERDGPLSRLLSERRGQADRAGPAGLASGAARARGAGDDGRDGNGAASV